MKIKSLLALICCFSTAFLGGCAPSGIDDGELMRPPKTTGDEEEITKLIEKSSGDNYSLKYPENGNNRSAIIMTDLDSDSNNEAIAFYQTADAQDTVTHMLIMYRDNSGWSLAGDSQTQNTDIDRVEFADINGDGNIEIITGYKTFNSNVKQLNVYSYSTGESRQIDVSQTYTSFVINDFDKDSQNDILTFSLYTDKQSQAALLSYNPEEEKIVPISSVDLNQNVTSIESIASGKLNDEQIGAVLDGTIAGDKLCTQIIYYDSNEKKLINGLDDKSRQTLNPTIRDVKTYCIDIDKNDIIEIPTLSKMSHGEEENIDSVATCVTWNEFDSNTGTLAENCYMIVNYGYSYYFQLSKDFKDNTTARIDAEDNSMTVYEWDANGLGLPLLTIKTYNSDDWSTTGKNDGFSLIKQDGSKAFCYKILNSESNFKFTDDDVQKSFVLFSEYAQS